MVNFPKIKNDPLDTRALFDTLPKEEKRIVAHSFHRPSTMQKTARSPFKMPKPSAVRSTIVCAFFLLSCVPSAFAQNYRDVLTAEALNYSGKGEYGAIGQLRDGVMANVGAYLGDVSAMTILGRNDYPAYANARFPVRCDNIVYVDMKIVMEGYTLGDDSPDKFITITGSNVMRDGGVIHAGPYQAEMILPDIPFCKRPSDKDSVLTNLGIALFDFHNKTLVAVLTEHRYPLVEWRDVAIEMYDGPRPTGDDGFPDGAAIRPLKQAD